MQILSSRRLVIRRWFVVMARLALLSVPSIAAEQPAARQKESAFYLAENPAYTILQSARDSIRFTLEKTLRTNETGHLVSISSFVNPEAQVMSWHDFGNLEGPGWAANAAGGAWEIYNFGKFLGDGSMPPKALAILDHVLEDGFVDEATGLISAYRETTTGKLCLNYKHGTNWFCPGSMAKVAYQLLLWSDTLSPSDRSGRLRTIALHCADWIQRNVEPAPNGWFPRRVTPEGKIYRLSPEGGEDHFWQSSADSLFILQLQSALTERGFTHDTEQLRRKAELFMRLGGIFGSINHDTYDPFENVAYSVAFRTFLLTSRVLHDPAMRQFAYNKCLAGLESFKMIDDRNGVATKGLLYMEKSWDTAYLWENAEAALAFFEAAADSRSDQPQRSRQYELDGLTILRAIAKHHYGPHGFLTEGVDWNDHVGQQHHINQAKYGAIQYTEPFLNNQHLVEPTLYYLQHLAVRSSDGDRQWWLDTEGNRLFSRN